MKGATMLSKSDIISWYHQGHIKGEYIYKATFCTRYENYEFVVVPFGITNAPTPFMCLMKNVLHPYLDKIFIVFVDDILVYLNNEEEHAMDLESMLILLRRHQFYAKLSK